MLNPESYIQPPVSKIDKPKNRPIENRSYTEAILETVTALAKEEKIQTEKIAPVDSGFLSKFVSYKRYINYLLLATKLAGFVSTTGCDQANAEFGGFERATFIDSEAESTDEKENEGTDVDLKEIVKKNPSVFLFNIDEYLRNPQAGEVLIDLVSEYPDLVLEGAKQFENETYYNDVIDKIFETNPKIVTKYLPGGDFQEEYNNKEKLIEKHGLPLEYFEVEAEKAKTIRDRFETGKGDIFDFYKMIYSDDEFSVKDKITSAEIMKYVLDKDLNVDQVREILNDPDSLFEARFYIVINSQGSEKTNMELNLGLASNEVIKNINHKKGLSQSERFSEIKDCPHLELYSHIVFAGHNAIDSTSRPLFRSFFRELKKNDINIVDFFESVDSYKVQEFIGNSVVVNFFTETMNLTDNQEEKEKIVELFLENIEQGDTEKKINIISKTIHLNKNSEIKIILKDTLKRKYNESLKNQNEEAETAYGLLSALYGEEADWLGDDFENYEIENSSKLEIKELVNDDNESVHRVHFFNDADGISSFGHFMGEYVNSKDWDIKRFPTHVEIRSTNETGPRIIKYANRPEASSIGSPKNVAEFNASGLQDGNSVIEKILKDSGKTVNMEVLRGHSYYQEHVANRISQDTAIFLDGSCKGVSGIADIKSSNPDMRVIYNEKTGRANINWLIERHINNSILENKTIDFFEIRKKVALDLTREFQDEDEASGELRYDFSKYVFPGESAYVANLVSIKFSEMLNEKNG